MPFIHNFFVESRFLILSGIFFGSFGKSWIFCIWLFIYSPKLERCSKLSFIFGGKEHSVDKIFEIFRSFELAAFSSEFGGAAHSFYIP